MRIWKPYTQQTHWNKSCGPRLTADGSSGERCTACHHAKLLLKWPTMWPRWSKDPVEAEAELIIYNSITKPGHYYPVFIDVMERKSKNIVLCVSESHIHSKHIEINHVGLDSRRMGAAANAALPVTMQNCCWSDQLCGPYEVRIL